MVLEFEVHRCCNLQGVGRGQTISSETMAPLHAPHSYDAGPLEALPRLKEKHTALTSSNEEKGSEDDDLDDEDLVRFGEFVLATDNDSLISLSSHETICSLNPHTYFVV